jgi:23S rRNA (cytosine1962-C5)-methyltransferase
MTLPVLVAEASADYALLDSGHGRKLERCGPYRFIRPEAQAMWRPASADWHADAEFIGGSDEEGGGRWHFGTSLPPSWPIEQAGIRLHAACTPFRHLAFFPDMAPHWQALAEASGPGSEVLNLFGYTGAASLVAARAGARVTHVDASKKAVEAARANAALSGLHNAPIRWLTDDARKFVAREVRRGRRYDAILLDPPKFGRGPEGEVWDLTQHLPALLADCAQLLDGNSRLLILTTYALRLSAVAVDALMCDTALPAGRIESGEMAIREDARGLLLPTALYSRWTPDLPPPVARAQH